MEKESIKISIIMTSYNYEKFLVEAIESILNQKYANWELIIVDDGSVDNSVEIIKKYCEKDNRIKLFQHKNNKNNGLKASILLAVKNASSDWITFLESDDKYKSNYLDAKVKSIINNPELDLIFNDVELFGDDSAIKGYENYLNTRQSIIKNNKIKYSDLLVVNIIPSFSCVMIKKDIFLSCNFDVPMPQALDYFLWTQVLSKVKTGYLSEKLTFWRKHARNYTNWASFSKKQELDSALLKVLASKKVNDLRILIYSFIRKDQVEKFFRPQVKLIGNFIIKMLLKNKTFELVNLD